MVSRRARACDISVRVKREVWERDGGACVVCGNTVNVAPNAHVIPRSQGGLGIPQNIVTLCTDFTPNRCHWQYDHGGDRERIGKIIRAYLSSVYPGWDEERVVYDKWSQK